MIPSLLARLPVFVLCEDGRYYEELVYGDHPLRHGWFLCFDDKEPAEIVIKESEYQGGNFGPADILKHRGFGKVLRGLSSGRKEAHTRYFGGCDPLTGRPLEPAPALSWFCLWKKGVRFPIPCQYDVCKESYPIMPPRAGVFFGVNP